MNKLHYADEEYYLTSEYLLKLAANAGKLFESSEPEQKRLLLKLTLQNLTLEGKTVRYEGQKPFDQIFNLAGRHLWLSAVSALMTYFLGTNEEFEPIFL